ncbi:adhesion G protein-coupled receptor B2 [Trichonephila clavipes]|nr:adhesion G protein-coupled receptor B2 [Trichonephila clavipes]
MGKYQPTNAACQDGQKIRLETRFLSRARSKIRLVFFTIRKTEFLSLENKINVSTNRSFSEFGGRGLKKISRLNEKVVALHFKYDFWHMTATAGSDVVQSGRPIFDDFFQHLWPYIGNNTANVVFQMVKRLWLIRIDQ